MLNRLLFFALFLISCACSFKAKASHWLGGEISVARDTSNPGFSHRIDLILYLDVQGTLLGDFGSIRVYTTPNNVLAYQFGIPYTDLDTVASQTGTASYTIGKYTYSQYVNLSTDTAYDIVFGECCRNSCIQNLANPAIDQMLRTHYQDSTASAGLLTNSSPIFLNNPVCLGKVLQPISYNPLAYDPDGDSLVYQLGLPLSTSPVSWSVPLSDSTGPFTFDSTTGILCWTPSTVGCWQYSIDVKEYRNGVLIGNIQRDYQMIISPPDSGAVPGIGVGPCDPDSLSSLLYVNANNVVGLDFLNTTSATVLEAFGEPFLLGASYVVTSPTPTSKRIEMLWNPDTNHARPKPYQIAFRMSNGQGQRVNDYTVVFKVQDTTGLGLQVVSTSMQVGQAYPNPASQSLFVPISMLQPAELNISLMDLAGKVLYSQAIGNVSSKAPIELPLTVPSGLYLLNIKSANGSHTQRISVVR